MPLSCPSCCYRFLQKLLESMLTVLTQLLHIFENAQNVSGFFAVFFLQSRSAVLDCGHTSGQHAQCLLTPTTHFQILNFFSRLMVIVMNMLWPWILTRLQDSMLSDMTHLLHTFTFYLFFWSHGYWDPASHSCRRPWPHCAWCGSVLDSLGADLSSFWLSNLAP